MKQELLYHLHFVVVLRQQSCVRVTEGVEPDPLLDLRRLRCPAPPSLPTSPPRAGTFIYHTHWHEPSQLTNGLYGPLIALREGETFDPKSDLTFVFSIGDFGALQEMALINRHATKQDSATGSKKELSLPLHQNLYERPRDASLAPKCKRPRRLDQNCPRWC